MSQPRLTIDDRPVPFARTADTLSAWLARAFASTSAFPIACAGAIVLGLAVRAWPVLTADFPLNDGGLFLEMTEELRRAGYRLPAFSAYNDAGIPYAYAPFAFYVAALLAEAGIPLVATFRYLPLLVSVACIGAVLLLARDLVRSRLAIVTAVVAFALVPRSWVWLVMGGGITRAFGFLFAILAIREANRLYTLRRRRHAITAGVLAGLTVLSHLGTAPFAAFSIVIFLLARGLHRDGILGTFLIAIIATAISAPWWATVIAAHGIEPFLAAQATGGSIFTPGEVGRAAIIRLSRFGAYTTGEGLLPVVALLGIAGALATLATGPLILAVWWIAALVLDTRAGQTYASVPLALLAGIGVRDVLLPVLRRGALVPSESDRRPSSRLGEVAGALVVQVRRALPVVVPAVLIAYVLFGVTSRDPDRAGELAYLGSLRAVEREAMERVERATPPGTRVLVIPGDVWAADRYSEWFPVLSRRTSVATVQGLEWLPGGVFRRMEVIHQRLFDCSNAPLECLEKWERMARLPFTHIFVPGSPTEGCCGTLRLALQEDPRWRLVEESEGGQLFERLTR